MQSVGNQNDRHGCLWWLSVPYSVAFPLFVLAFGYVGGPCSGLGAFLYFLSVFSSAAWIVLTLTQWATSDSEKLTRKTRVRLGVAIMAGLLGIILLAWLK